MHGPVCMALSSPLCQYTTNCHHTEITQCNAQRSSMRPNCTPCMAGVYPRRAYCRIGGPATGNTMRWFPFCPFPRFVLPPTTSTCAISAILAFGRALPASRAAWASQASERELKRTMEDADALRISLQAPSMIPTSTCLYCSTAASTGVSWWCELWL